MRTIPASTRSLCALRPIVFVIEFDSKCHTERRYDYLEFTDASGGKRKFDGEVNLRTLAEEGRVQRSKVTPVLLLGL